MLGTPPTSSVSKTPTTSTVASDRATISKKKLVHVGFSPLSETSNSDALVYTHETSHINIISTLVVDPSDISGAP